MRKGLSERAIITVETKTGKIISVVDEHGHPAGEATEEDLNLLYESTQGFRYVSTILHQHSSPGCVWVNWGGNFVWICGP